MSCRHVVDPFLKTMNTACTRRRSNPIQHSMVPPSSDSGTKALKGNFNDPGRLKKIYLDFKK